jgi:ABC-type dipeptide/oligopeptide/nickel transport system ATPase component
MSAKPLGFDPLYRPQGRQRSGGLQHRVSHRCGVVRAVDGISYTVDPGETVAIVGESGSGKSVGALSILRLIPDPPGRIVGGEVIFAGRDLMQLSDAEMREVRGGEIGMVFQEPMTSLNPVLTIGRQITEMVEQHRGMDRAAAGKRAIELLGLVGIADPRAA